MKHEVPPVDVNGGSLTRAFLRFFLYAVVKYPCARLDC